MENNWTDLCSKGCKCVPLMELDKNNHIFKCTICGNWWYHSKEDRCEKT